MKRIERLALLLLLTFMLVAGSTSTHAAAPVRKHALSVEITTAGVTTLGTVRIAYLFRHQRVSLSCSISRCLFNIPHGARLTFRQTPKQSGRVFQEWQVTRLQTQIGLRVIKKPSFVFVMKHDTAVMAIYVRR